MKIKSFDYIKRDVPNMSCGTGYSEADHFHITCDNGFETDVTIDIWYLTEESSKQEFITTMYETFGSKLENLPEAFEMYKQALRPHHCPWFWMEEEN